MSNSADTYRAIVIPVEGDVHDERISRADHVGLRTLQKLVGGFIEAVSKTTDSLTFWVNEEGKLTGLPPNVRATLLWWHSWPEIARMDVLCGDVVLTGGADRHGDTKGLPECFKPAIPDVHPSHEWQLGRERSSNQFLFVCEHCHAIDPMPEAQLPCTGKPLHGLTITRVKED